MNKQRSITKTFLVFIVLSLAKSSGITQITTPLNKDLWIATNINIFTAEDHINYLTPVGAGSFISSSYYSKGILHLGLGIKRTNEKKWFQEYSVNALSWDKKEELSVLSVSGSSIHSPISGFIQKTLNIWLRWEYGKMFLKSEEQKIITGISIAADPYILKNKYIPRVSGQFARKNIRLGTELRIIPRVEYKLTSNLKMSLKIPLKLAYIYWDFSRQDNLFLPDDWKNSNITNYNIDLSNVQLSIGMSYRVL